MTEPLRDERVQESGVVGHSFDTDDRLGDLDIYEALVNPHEEHTGGKPSAPGGPTMLPMGGAGTSAGASTGTEPGGGTTAGGAAKGTSAASAGTGRGSRLSGTDGVGAGATGFGASGRGDDSLSGGGGASPAGLGTGGLIGGGSPWGAPPSGTGAAGMTDPTLPGAGTGPGFTPGEIAGPRIPVTSPPTIPTNVPAPPGGSSVPSTIPATGGASGSGIAEPSVTGAGVRMPSGAGKVAGTAGLGATTITASPEMLHKEALYWDDTAKEVSANIADPIRGLLPSSVDFGMMKDAFGAYNDLLTRLKKWSSGAGAEFSAISDALQAASGGYCDTEATNAAATGSGTSRPE